MYATLKPSFIAASRIVPNLTLYDTLQLSRETLSLLQLPNSEDRAAEGNLIFLS
jgi:hypothetical protein